MTTKEHFTITEIIEEVKKALNDGFNKEFTELHNVAFASYDHDAKEALESYGVFDAMEKLKRNEISIYGATVTDFTDYETFATNLFYVLGTEAVIALFQDFYEKTDIDIEALHGNEYTNKFLSLFIDENYLRQGE